MAKVNFISINPRQTKEQTRAFVKECTLQEYESVINSDSLADLARRISETDDEDEQRKLKSQLPFRCPHYTRFRDNYRDREHIDPESFTWQTCVDIDDKEQVEMANRRSQELDKEPGMWQGMLLHKDYSARKKLHIDIRLPLGMTVPEAQRAYCKALGVKADTTCFTPERFIYITPADYEICRKDGWYGQLSDEEVAQRRKAYTERGLTIDGRTASGSYYDAGEETAETVNHEVAEKKQEEEFPKDFKGIAYANIIKEWWNRTGGEPAKGERNKRLHQLAANLRSICDNDEAWLMAVMPRYDLSEQEMQSIVHSACKEATKGSKLMDSIVKYLAQVVTQTEGSEASEPAIPKVSIKSLPAGLKESLKCVPESMHMPVLCSIMPLAAALADQVEVRYCDGKTQRLGMMSIIVGEQASGKSVCKYAVNTWKRQLDAEDALARKREDEWKELKKSRKSNEKAPDDPKVLIRVVPVTVSCSTLLRRLKNARGHILYSFGEELDTLNKSNAAGSWSAKYDIYRLAFDPIDSEWGQDYNSDQAESGVVKVAYNWTMLGTQGALQKCFKSENIENGLSSRVLIADMPDNSFAKMPKYDVSTPEDEEEIQKAVTRLRSFTGFVDTPRLRRRIEQWVEAKRVEAAKDIDHVKDTYRRRAAVIGFRCGVIFHLLSGCDKESRACLDFAEMMAEYCLAQQIKVFGNMLQKQYANSITECRRATVNHSIFDQLTPAFTIEDLAALKNEPISRNALVKIISRWRRDGWVEKVDSNHYAKVQSE